MSFIRKSGVVVFCIALFLALILTNALFTMYFSLRYDNVEPQLVELVKTLSSNEGNFQEQIAGNYDEVLMLCTNMTSISINQSDYSFDIPCSVVKQGSNSVFEYGVRQMVNQAYYKKYNCEFLQGCFNSEKNSGPFFLVSEQSMNYFKGKFFLGLVISFMFAVLVFLLLEEKINSLLLFGSLVAISSVPFLLISAFLSSSNDEMMRLVSGFFIGVRGIFYVLLIFGILLVVSGIILKIVDYIRGKNRTA